MPLSPARTLKRSALWIAASCIFLLTACGASTTSAPASTPRLTIGEAMEDNPDHILPTQAEIRARKPFPYLMAVPETERFSARQWRQTTSRLPATQRQFMSTDSDPINQTNEQCSVYEQLGLGLFTTPGGSFETVDGERRRIALGQSGIDQLSGYVSIFSTPHTHTASKLLEDFEENALACSQNLQELYRDSGEVYHLDPPQRDDISGTLTLSGQYWGDSFVLKVNKVDNCLLTTWFRTTGHGNDVNLPDTTSIIHSLEVEKASQFAPRPH